MNPTYRGTRLRSFRIEDELYERAKAGSEARGVSLSDVVRQALEAVAVPVHAEPEPKG